MAIKTHTLTVCRARGYEYRDRVPCLTIQGKWLKEMGIEVGDRVHISQVNNQIVLELVNEDNPPNKINSNLL